MFFDWQLQHLLTWGNVQVWILRPSHCHWKGTSGEPERPSGQPRSEQRKFSTIQNAAVIFLTQNSMHALLFLIIELYERLVRKRARSRQTFSHQQMVWILAEATCIPCLVMTARTYV